jgi:hypothetical protein
VVVFYLFGALLSSAFIVHKVDEVALLPFCGVAAALVLHQWAHRKPW